MDECNIQADLLETARALILKDPDRFSVAALCRETGLSRNRMRQYFPTKAALMTALLEPSASENLQDEISGAEDLPEDSVPAITNESWIERRLRVFERALALLENKTEGASLEQSHAQAMIGERLSGPISASLAELPPIVEVSKTPERETIIVVESAPSIPANPEPLVVPPLEFHAPQPAFHAREKLQTILENVAPAQTAPEKPKLLQDVPPWMMFSAGLAGTAAALGLLLVISNARNTPAPIKAAPQAAIAIAAHTPVATPNIYEQSSHVVVIDATGATPAGSDLDTRAERGDAHAKVEAALAYLRGDGVEADAGAGMRWVQAAATQGDATAQFILGSLYAKGMAPDPARASKWYAAAAEQGNVRAMHNLGLAYLNGDGVEKNAATAIDWFTKAATNGYVDSAMNLAVLFDRGEGVARNPQSALQWYDRAATLGDTEAAHRAKTLRAQLSRIAGR
ncbi:MAG: tetratricopeptide repeat protein [Pseudomonadota bacterium]